ncbi:MAG: putative Ig domain-containing protein [Bryobacteraceae bacterium]|nr:putative Ig domain-containing protein [Bryobacteraceae bacterium]
MVVVLGLLALGYCNYAQGQIRKNDGFSRNVVPANDDGSSPLVPIGWTLNFFGRQRSHAYVNNNGNITFDAALPDYTPFGLKGVSREIIAPFFADVDTRAAGSSLVTYGQDLVDGRRAFAANYINVGYFNTHADKLNSFQLVLIERPDTGQGNFDIEFNYERVTWETGDASGGVNGFGGVPASAGWSNGSGLEGTSFELAGSLIPGAFLDNGPYSLVAGRAAGTAARAPLGRWIFRARDGILIPPLTIRSGCPLPNATAGRLFAYKLEAAGARPPYRWTMIPDPGASTGGLELAPSGIVSGVPASPGNFGFTLRVSSADEDGEQSISSRCTVTVDPPSIFISSNASLPPAIAGSRYETRLRAEGGAGPFQFRTVDSSEIPGLKLSADGVLSGVPAAPGVYQLQVMATSGALDRAVPSSKRFLLTVSPSDLAVKATCPLPAGAGGVPYSFDFQVEGGVAPYRWSSVGSLPRGLFLSQQGRLSGIPSVPHWWPFDVRVEDARGRVAESGCGLLIAFPEVQVRNACALPPAAAGVAYSQRLEAEGGAGPYSWSFTGTLPGGLSLSQNGELTGTALAAGNTRFRVTVTDSQGQSGSSNCSLAVTRGQYAVASCPLPEAHAGEPYSTIMSAAGGAEPYVWSASAALPEGLRLGRDGHLSGVIETAGVYRIPALVTDRNGQSASRSCDLRVVPSQLRIVNACELPVAGMGSAYRASLAAAGGTAPYVFTPRSLPPGLRLGPDGQLSGVPEQNGSFPLAVEVKDQSGQTASISCRLSVRLPAPPEVRISGMPQTLAPASAGPPVEIVLSSAYPLPLEAEAILDVQADSDSGQPGADQPDPAVRFSNGQRRMPVQFPAGVRQVKLPIEVTGTVASTLRLTLSRLRVTSTNTEFPLQAPPVSGQVSRLAPILTNACYTPAEDGFVLEISGYSTTRELARADLTFGSNRYSVSLASASLDYFGGAESIPNGGTFRIRAPFRFQSGTAQSLGEGSATVFNRVGGSSARQIRACQ